MKISTEKRDIEITGATRQKEFTVKAGAHVMSILSGLYPNPILAIVREYLTNMNDAYVALFRERPDAPFIPPELHLPNRLNPTVQFKDYGIGMSVDTVWNVFTTYGESTKTGNDEEVGGFGLGSKTAFCYNDGQSWNIESRFDGQKHTFMAFVGEDGVPNMLHVSSVDTDEPSGVTVTVPINASDFGAVADAATKMIPHFPMELKVIGLAKIPEKPRYKFSGLGWGASIRSRAWGTKEDQCTVVMGNVPYVVDTTNIITKSVFPQLRKDPALKKLTTTTSIENIVYAFNYVITVPIGSVHVVPSRDSLKYTEKTNTCIADNLIVAVKGAILQAIESVQKSTTLWEAFEAHHSLSAISWDLVRLNNTWNGFELSREFLTFPHTSLHNITGVVQYAIKSQRNATIDVEDFWEEKKSINISKATILVINDVAKRADKLVRGLVKKNFMSLGPSGIPRKSGHKIGQVLLIDTTLDIPDLCKMFGGIPESMIVRASSLTIPKVTRVASPKKKNVGIYKYSRSYGMWKIEENPDFSTPEYFVPLTRKNGRASFESGSATTYHALSRLCGVISNAKTDNIYGVVVSSLHAVPKTWIDLVAAAQHAIDTEYPSVERDIALSSEFTTGINVQTTLTLTKKSKTLAATPHFKKVLDHLAEIDKVKKSNSASRGYVLQRAFEDVRLALKKPPTVQSTTFKSLADLLKELYDNYPILSIFSGEFSTSSYAMNQYINKHIKHIEQYVTLLDMSRAVVPTPNTGALIHDPNACSKSHH
jgi:hypothetical protein